MAHFLKKTVEISFSGEIWSNLVTLRGREKE